VKRSMNCMNEKHRDVVGDAGGESHGRLRAA
jgi:hypothetical protein